MLAGVCGTDPFRLMPVFLDELNRIGFSGVQNFPTVGLFDGTIRVGLEETGMGFGLEVDMIRLAHERDLLTAPYVFNDDEATAMARGGRRRARAAHGADDRRRDRRRVGEDARRVGAARPGHARRRQARQPGDPRPLPRRPDRRAGRRRLRAREHRGRRRLLRRELDGAPADRGRDDREHAPLQGDPRQRRRSDEHVRQAGRRPAGAVRLGHDRLAPRARDTGSKAARDHGRDARARRAATTSTATRARRR